MREKSVEITFRSVNDKRTKNAKAAAIVLRILQWIPLILKLTLVICMIPLLYTLAPVLSGEVELDNPLTNSQLTAMIALLVLFYFLRKMR